MKLSDIIKDAKDLISDPARWTRHAHARTKDGDECSPFNERATCWCAIGALQKSINTNIGADAYYPPLLMSIGDAFDKANNGGAIVDTNDYSGHDAILEALDNTIKYLESENN